MPYHVRDRTPGENGPSKRLCRHEHETIPQALECGRDRIKHTLADVTQPNGFLIYDVDKQRTLTCYQVHQAVRQEQIEWERRHPPYQPVWVEQPYKRFREIPPFMEGNYNATIPLNHLRSTLDDYDNKYILDMDPDFQRVHVWTQEQQSAFVEHILRGGRNTDIRWNCPGWMSNNPREPQGPVTLVDGKQRLTAALDFLDDRIPAFGQRLSQWEDGIPPFTCNLNFIVNDLETRAEILKWYLEINRGNVAHTPEEISKVEELLRQEIS